jgi:hypothetical protein
LAGVSDAPSTGDDSESESRDAEKIDDNTAIVSSSSQQPVVEQDRISDRPAVEDNEPVNVRIVEMPSLTGDRSAGTRKAPDANDVSLEQPVTAEDSEESQPDTIEPGKETTRTKRRWGPLRALAVATGSVLAIAILAALLFVLRDGRSLAKSRSDLTTRDTQNQCVANRIVAYVGDQRQVLGEADTVTEITIGRDLSSTVYIEDECVSDTHLRIFKARETFKAQNLANGPVTINGTELRPKAKMQLALPADIELVPGLSVTLLTEPIDPDAEVDNDEYQAE